MTPAAAVLDAGYALARPLLFRLEAERAHTLVLGGLAVASRFPAALAVVRRLLGVDEPRYALEAFGLRFANPIGVAAGLDKNGIALPSWAALGFGHVEVGTVTPESQPGNPHPRVFRLPRDQGLINRMGFPNEGAARVGDRLSQRPSQPRIVVGGNVGKGRATPLEAAPDDYARAAQMLRPYVDYLAANVSSPNTPGLRTLQAPEQIARILERLVTPDAPPVLVKLAPDLDLAALPEIVDAARRGGAAGLIATNTTISRAAVTSGDPTAREEGGLSGVPLREQALRFTSRLAEIAGPDFPIVGVGGIFTAQDVRERLQAGARLVQVYTALVYVGPALVPKLLNRR